VNIEHAPQQLLVFEPVAGQFELNLGANGAMGEEEIIVWL
jgi:hypothetical protein